MSNLVFSIDDTEITVSRPVAFDVVKSIMDFTQISSKTKLEIIGDEGKSIQPGSAIDNFNIDHNKYPYNDKVTIEVSEMPVQDFTLATTVNQMQHRPFFRDDCLGILMRPVNVITEVTITFKYRAEDRNKAIKWQNAIRAKSNLGVQNVLHTVKYSYAIPYNCIAILKEIHRLRNNVAPYNDTFEQYFEDKCSKKLTKVSNQSGKYQQYSLLEIQNNIQGQFDFIDVPDKPDRVDDSSAYSSTFTYKFKYNKPCNVNMIYPVFIHNQVLDEKYRFDFLLKNLDYKNGDGNFSQTYANEFLKLPTVDYPSDIGYTIPNFDSEFFPRYKITATGDILNAVTIVESNDLRYLLNLKDLGDHDLDPDVIQYLIYEHSNFTNRNKTVFNLNLYCYNELVKDSILTVNSNLDVFSTEDLDLRKLYRVRLSLLCDLQDIVDKPRFKEYCRNNINFRDKIARAIFRLLKTRTVVLKRPINRNTLSLEDLKLLGIITNDDLYGSKKMYLDYLDEIPFYPLTEILFLSTNKE